MYEYLVTENRAGWQPWRERVPSWKYPRTHARALFLLMPCTAHVHVLLNLKVDSEPHMPRVS